MQVLIGYPDARHEANILRLVRAEALKASQDQSGPTDQPDHAARNGRATEQFALQELFAARREVLEVFMADDVEDYIVRLITATRVPAEHDPDLSRWLEYGASPRGTLCLDSCARAHAWLDGRDYVSPGDVQAIVYDVLRHRLLLSFEAEADGVNADAVIDRLLRLIAVP